MDLEEKKYEYNVGLYDVTYRQFILNLLNEFDIDYAEEWVSKYDDCVRIPYKPTSTAGFMYNVQVNGEPNVVNFIDYLIKQHIENIEKLNKLIKETKEDK